MIRAVAISVGSRYAFSRRSTISFISLVAIGGLALSVAVLVVVVSVINGFERELEQRIFGVLPHVSFVGREPMEPTPEDLESLSGVVGIEGVAPFIQGAGLVAVADRVSGVVINGIDPDSYQHISLLSDFVRGELAAIAGDYEVVLGGQIAKQLRVTVGDMVTLVLPTATVTPAGLFPRQKRFTVSGVLESRSEVDSRAAYIHIGDAQRLFRLGTGVHGYQVRLKDLFSAAEIASLGVARLGRDRIFARSWMRTHGNLYRAIGVMKSTMFVLLSFLVAVAAFNLVSTLVMVVDQRSGDVAIMRTLGSDTATLIGAFVVLGTLLGALGILIGVIAGVSIGLGLPHGYQWLAATLDMDLMSQYFVSYLPVQIRFADVLGIAATAFALCILSTLYPARRAVTLQPAQVLAHE
ncbi:MAG: lipoprotein-releasing ABC transporter permease subunit [Gammaproteobacteria bacterium]|nr:lipoprotein-releasing ABC transporter permease subunit [Gammaproteobacteria bacterium]